MIRIKPGETIEEGIANHKKMIVNYFLQTLQSLSLEKFKKSYGNKYDIQEIKPPRDGIAYYCSYKYVHHTMSEYIYSIGMLWDKDGNPMGFMLQGETYMFADEKSRVNIPLDSHLAKVMRSALNKEVRIIEPAFGGVAYIVKGRNVMSLRPKGSDGRAYVKSVWFEAVHAYDAQGRLLSSGIIDEDIFSKYEVPAEYYQPADPVILEMYSRATHKVAEVKDASGKVAFRSVPVKEQLQDSGVKQAFNSACVKARTALNVQKNSKGAGSPGRIAMNGMQKEM